jgi:DNA-directed RNA polymerase subunit N (RpoN/RPB10)
MLCPKCFTCGHVLANIELPYEEGMYEIDNNVNFDKNKKIIEKQKLIDKLLPDRWKLRYCCRTRLISYVDLIHVIV